MSPAPAARLIRPALALLLAAAPLSAAVAAPAKPAAKPTAPATGPDLPSKLPLTSPFVTVNGEKVTVGTYVDRLSLSYGAQLREGLILEALIRQEAARRKITATPAEVNAMVDKVYQDYALRAGGEQKMAEELKNSRGWSLSDFKQVIKEQTPVQVLRQKLTVSLVPDKSVTDADLQTRYEERKEAFQQPESVRISHILFQRYPTDPAKDAASREKAEALLKQILEAKGGNFDAFAKQKSEDETTRAGGGRVAAPIVKGSNPFGTSFEIAVFEAKVGIVDKVVVSPMGYHLVRLDAKQPERVVPLSEVRTQIKEALLAERREKAVDELFVKLRGTAKINTGRF